ncbi:MAG: hypothetical protein LBS88_02990, partial [Tannerellaceae bacterium]|nr:hypothetical protein [Tannerellaceae bacterium]
EDGKYYFEYSNNNQKGYRHLQFQTYAAIELVKDHLNASVVSAINRYFNFGDTYTHCYTGYYNRFQFDGYYKNWSLSVSLNLKSKMLSGETLQSYATTADFSTRYRYKSFQYGLEIMNPFLPDGNPGKQETISEYVQKEVTQYNKNYGNMIRFTVAWNIDFGRKYNNKQKQINQADYESGIIKL